MNKNLLAVLFQGNDLKEISRAQLFYLEDSADVFSSKSGSRLVSASLKLLFNF